MSHTSETSVKCRRLQQWKTDDILLCVATKDDARIFAGSSDFHVYEVLPAEKNLERKPLEGDAHESYVTGLAVAGRWLVSGSYDGRLIWWDLETGKSARAVAAHSLWIRRVIATPDGTRVISVADDMRCRVWDAETGEQVLDLSDHAAKTPHHFPSMLYAVTVSPDGKLLAAADKVGHVAIWDLGSGEKLGQVESPEMYTWDPKQRIHSIGGVRSLAFSPDGQRLAVGGIGQIGNIDHLGAESRLEVFQWHDGQRQLVITDDKNKGLVEQITWRPHAEQMHLVTAGGDHKGFLSVWNAADGSLVSQESLDGHVHGYVLNRDATSLYLACHQRLEQWSLLAEDAQETPDS